MTAAVGVVPDFDEELHVYRVDGRVIPSVTEILRVAGIGHTSFEGTYQIPDEVMEAARERGGDVHLACEYIDRGGIEMDWDDGDPPEWWPYVEAYEQFKEDTGFVPTEIEQQFYCAEFDYSGTRDRVGWIGDDLVVMDLKSGGGGLKPWHRLQLAAYSYPLKLRGTWPMRIMLELKPHQKRTLYRAHRFFPSSSDWDFQVFIAARTIWTFKELLCK